MSKLIDLNGRSIDVGKALPLTLRDWKELEKSGISAQSLSNGRITDMAAVLYLVLHKADATVTQDEVDGLPMNSKLLPQIARYINEEDPKVDRPFSTSSTDSPAPTAGPGAT